MYVTERRLEREALQAWRARGTSARTAAPVQSPVSVETFVRHVREDSSTLDAELALQYLDAATSWVETYTGRALLEQTWTLTLDTFPWWYATPGILLPRVPVLSVTSVIGYNAAGTGTTMSAVTDYSVDLSEPARVLLRDGISWPADLRTYGGIVVTYIAGYGTTPESVPAELRQAIALLAAHWHKDREASTDLKENEIPFGVKALVDPYRVSA